MANIPVAKVTLSLLVARETGLFIHSGCEKKGTTCGCNNLDFASCDHQCLIFAVQAKDRNTESPVRRSGRDPALPGS